MEAGESGLRGLSVTRVVTAARKQDIGSATILFRYMEELTAPETDTKQRTVIQRVALVSEM